MDAFLPEELQKRLKEIGEADLVVGIPSYNNARTIGQVVRAAAAGLAKYFPDRRAILINSDGGSKDGTREAVLNAEVHSDSLLLTQHPTSPLQRVSSPYQGVAGKGSAFRQIFAVTKQLKARACVVFDSDLRSITPQWVELLARPVLERKIDFVAPYYLRHKFDGTITNGIIYPITRSLFGKRVRQPIGGDFGFSGRLAARYLEKDVWESDVARFGIDIWMTITAIAEGFEVSQAYLGAKIHDAKDPGGDLTAMFRQVVGSLFGLMETYEKVWQTANGSQQVPMFGFPFEVGVEPIAVNIDRMVRAYAQGVIDLREVYATFLTQKTRDALQICAQATAPEFRMPDQLWVHAIYEFAAAWKERKIDRDHLMQSLVPIYLGRTASFVLEMQSAGPSEVEARVDQLADVFEAERSYLRVLWEKDSAKAVQEENNAKPV